MAEEKENKRYFIQDKRGYVGNCILWWALNDCGYTCHLAEAQIYTEEEAKAFIELIKVSS